MNATRRLFAALCCILALGGSNPSWADPCGMVPPVYTGGGDPIKRVGPQRTYVFYKNGIESIVLRPAFSGKVSNFGMLIPFPSVPAIRKVPDNIFSHITAAIDPPEVRVWVYRRRYRRYRRSRAKKAMPMPSAPSRLSVSSVRVVRKEAVGMYQVAVLEAGSPKALKRWMKKHGYVYPKGMDKVVLEYIRVRWYFVAVKTRVAGKSGVTPRPGMRSAKAKFPKGGTFQGAVQAMGFRFRTRKLVVPMRLSAFNKGRLRNIVYLMTAGPRRIKHISQQFVRRQLTGAQLYRNVTSLLPLRVFGGPPSKIRRHQWRWLQQRRNPVPHNGLARDLFASDLLAVRKNKLSLPYEEKKKILLRIGERLMLRGKQIDRLNRMILAAQRAKAVRVALRDLKRMTLTVVDGDFPRQIIARENLTFSSYTMPRNKNNFKEYNARFMRKPNRYRYRRGVRTTWKGPAYAQKWIPKPLKTRRAKPYRTKASQRARIARLIRQLRNPKKVNRALKQLKKMGNAIIPYMVGEILEQQPEIPRGWAIVALLELGNASVSPKLQKVHQDAKNPLLVRTWAAAARIGLARDSKQLMALLGLLSSFPATQRPFSKRLQAVLSGKKRPAVAVLLNMAARNWRLRKVLAPIIMQAGAPALAKVMIGHKSNGIRRMAAGYLGAVGQQNPAAAYRALLKVYRFKPKATDVPWKGGALYLPTIRWNQAWARKAAHELLSWYIWAERNWKSKELQQIHNNLRSLSFARIAGYRSPGWRNVGLLGWMQIWVRVVGCNGIRNMLMRQGLLKSPRYIGLWRKLGCT